MMSSENQLQILNCSIFLDLLIDQINSRQEITISSYLSMEIRSENQLTDSLLRKKQNDHGKKNCQ